MGTTFLPTRLNDLRQDVLISNPVNGQALTYNGTRWVNGAGGGGGGLGSATDVAAYATAGDGSAANPWTGWDTACPWAAETAFFFRKGIFAYATSPNYAFDGITLLGEAGSELYHTGSGNAVDIDGTASYIYRPRILNLTIR